MRRFFHFRATSDWQTCFHEVPTLHDFSIYGRSLASTRPLINAEVITGPDGSMSGGQKRERMVLRQTGRALTTQRIEPHFRLRHGIFG